MISGDASVAGHIDATLSVKEKISGALNGIGSVIGTIAMGGCSDIEVYGGDYEVLPSASDDVVLNTDGKKMKRDVTVFKIPYYETANLYGDTAYIG